MRDGRWLDAQEFPPLSWCVPGVVSEGFGLLVGPPKAGKSWMVGGIALACATGGMAFGRIPVQRRPVLYMALEDGHRRLQSRFRTLMEGGPIPPGISVIIQAEQNVIVATIAEFMIRHRGSAPLCILDTLGKARPPKGRGEDSYAADYAIGTQLKNVADSVRGASLLVVHHTRKAESTDFVDAVSGTQGIAGSADFVLVLARRRKSDQAVLSVTGRDIPENEYALVTEDGRWSLDGMDLADAAATVETRLKEQRKDSLGDRASDVLVLVNSQPGDTAATDVAEKLGISNDDAGKYLRRLAEKGLISKRGRGSYIRLSDVSEPSERHDMPSSGHESVSDASTLFSDASTLPVSETGPDDKKSATHSVSDASTSVSDTPKVEASETNSLADLRSSARSDGSDGSDTVVTQFDRVARARAKVLELLGGDRELTAREMRGGRISKETRGGVTAALELLVDSGEITARQDGQKTLYRLARKESAS
ncbi:AAA family ATPase [Nocardia aurea]|uniref:AAA family ATPase n=1 Tax=Nocardia aurea TaxID=2144174 RepID=UPI0033B173E2